MAEELELDDNLPSSLTYTDALSRGNVAIILYNTFFAEMYDEEVSYQEEFRDTDGDGYLETVITPVKNIKTVAEKVFEVTKSTQRAVATPNYYFNTAKMDASFDVDVIRFSVVKDGVAVEDAGFHTFEALDLPGKADDYFLSDFTLFTKEKVNQDGERETVILYAEPLLVKKTGVKATVENLSSSKDQDNYYVGNATGNDYEKYFKPTGKLTIDGQVTYMYDAPYSFAKPSITTKNITDAEYYERVNAKNAEFIGLADVLPDEENVYHFVTADQPEAASIDYLMGKEVYGQYTVGNDTIDVMTYSADTFAAAMSDMYWNGYYELDTYDCDGNGKIDYIWYKPFTFGKLVKDEDFSTESQHSVTTDRAVLDSNNVPTIYTYDAKIDGDYKNGDFALAYVNGPANYIKVSTIVPGVKAAVTSAPNQYALNLSDGSKVSLGDISRYVYGFHAGDISDEVGDWKITDRQHYGTGLVNVSAWNKTQMFYVLDGRLLYTDANLTSVWNDEAGITIPLTVDGLTDPNAGLPETEGLFASVNGKIKTVPFLSVFSFGFETDEYEKHPVDISAFDVGEVGDSLASYDIIETGSLGVYDFSNYIGKLCTYDVDEDGYYSIELVEDPYNVDPTVLSDKDVAGQAYFADSNDYPEFSTGVYLNRVTGNTYRLQDALTGGNDVITYTDNDGDTVTVKYLKLDANSKIIIKSGNDFKQYSANKAYRLTNDLTNVQIVLKNNASTVNSETLAVLYGETAAAVQDGAEHNVETYAIIKSVEGIEKASDGLYHRNFTVYNPIEGLTETAISSFSSSRATEVQNDAYTSAITAGMLVALIDGEVQTGQNDPCTQVVTTSVTDVDSASDNLTRVLSHEANELEVSRRVDAGNVNKMLKTNSDTVVAWLDMTSANVKDGEISVVDLEALTSESNKYRNSAEVLKDPLDPTNTTTVVKYEEEIEIFYTIDPDTDSTTYELVDFILIVSRDLTETQFNARAPYLA